MTQEIIMRIGLAIAISLLGWAVYWFTNRILIARTRITHPPIPGFRAGVPTLLYFTTPECVPCKTVQRPAIQRIQGTLGEQLSVIEINAQEHPDLAGKWGILSVPSTLILDKNGQLQHVNHGVTRAEQLLKQIEQVNRS